MSLPVVRTKANNAHGKNLPADKTFQNDASELKVPSYKAEGLRASKCGSWIGDDGRSPDSTYITASHETFPQLYLCRSTCLVSSYATQHEWRNQDMVLQMNAKNEVQMRWDIEVWAGSWGSCPCSTDVLRNKKQKPSQNSNSGKHTKRQIGTSLVVAIMTESNFIVATMTQAPTYPHRHQCRRLHHRHQQNS